MRYPWVFLPVLLAACADAPPGGDLAVAVVGSGDLAETLAAEATRATLVTRAAGGEIAPGLATSWRFLDDGDDLILRLAPLRWPGLDRRQGAELVAADVVASLRRVRTSARLELDAAGLSGRSAARAPIARVVELTPQPAVPHLLDWLAQPALAVVDQRGQAFPGPYGMTRDDDGTLRLARRGERPLPGAKAATILIRQQTAADALAAFASGKANLVLGEGLTGLSAARTAGQRRALQVEAVHGVIGLAVQTGGALADARLRRALLLAADGKPLADRIALTALSAQNRLWDELPPPQDDRALPPADRQAAAAALLAEAGFGAQNPLALTLLVPAGPEAAQLSAELAGRLAPIGIAIRIVRAASSGAVPRHDLALVEHAAIVPDALAHLARWRCGRAKPCSEEADNLLGDARAAGVDLAARAAALDKAETALMADPAFIPLLRPVRWALVGSAVKGYQANAIGWHPLGHITASR